MIRLLRAWWTLSQLGPARHVAGTVEEYFRHYVIKAVADAGVVDYLREPRTYGQILAHFDFADSDYARELFELLAGERRNVLALEDGRYNLNSHHSIPTDEELFARTDERYHNFSLLAKGMAKNVLYRLCRKPIEFTQSFEEQGREMLAIFDEVLGNQVYSVGRATTFALLKRRDLVWLCGKTLLEVGCGSGRETAELWLHTGGKTQITAIDPVPSMLERAEHSFTDLLRELDPDHPPLVDSNRPAYQQGSITQLPFDDQSFDAVFYAQVLPWTYDPRRAVAEVVRVVKPGGLIFGVQTCKPYASIYIDFVMRSNENSHGAIWKEEHQRWYAEHGIALEIATPIGSFWARKPG